MPRTPFTHRELLDLPPSVRPEDAFRVLNISRSKGYDLLRTGEFPCPVIRVGSAYRVPREGLLALLGVLREPVLTDGAA